MQKLQLAVLTKVIYLSYDPLRSTSVWPILIEKKKAAFEGSGASFWLGRGGRRDAEEERNSWPLTWGIASR